MNLTLDIHRILFYKNLLLEKIMLQVLPYGKINIKILRKSKFVGAIVTQCCYINRYFIYVIKLNKESLIEFYAVNFSQFGHFARKFSQLQGPRPHSQKGEKEHWLRKQCSYENWLKFQDKTTKII